MRSPDRDRVVHQQQVHVMLVHRHPAGLTQRVPQQCAAGAFRVVPPAWLTVALLPDPLPGALAQAARVVAGGGGDQRQLERQAGVLVEPAQPPTSPMKKKSTTTNGPQCW